MLRLNLAAQARLQTDRIPGCFLPQGFPPGVAPHDGVERNGKMLRALEASLLVFTIVRTWLDRSASPVHCLSKVLYSITL